MYNSKREDPSRARSTESDGAAFHVSNRGARCERPGRRLVRPHHHCRLPVDRWFDVAASVNRPFAVLAVLAVLVRNYWTVEAPDARRRIQWVVWATAIGFTPFLFTQLRRLVNELIGVPIGVDVAGCRSPESDRRRPTTRRAGFGEGHPV